MWININDISGSSDMVTEQNGRVEIISLSHPQMTQIILNMD